MNRYPHLNDTDFPILENIDVYKYENDFDYERWQPSVKIKLCRVNFDNEYNNVVKFESNETRDEYFNSIADGSIELDSDFHIFLNDSVKLPIPYDVLTQYNYLFIEIPVMTSENNKINYENSDNRKGRFYYFINDIDFVAPNTTECNLQLDVWTTYINEVNISNIMLNRGHAPMAAVTVEDYLDSPVSYISKLGSDDVVFGEPCLIKSSDEYVYNDGEMLACIVVDCDISGLWNTSYSIHDNINDTTIIYTGDRTPGLSFKNIQGANEFDVIALDASNLEQFLNNADSTYPQFKQCIKCVFFVSKKLVTIVSTYTWFSTTCYRITSNRILAYTFNLNKDMFGYDSKYADIAKLYMTPYCAIDIAYDDGSIHRVRVQDTGGKLELYAIVQLTYPWISIDSYINDDKAFAGSQTKTINYKNLNTHQMQIMGAWYETLHNAKIPLFAVTQSNDIYFDFSTRYDREQMQTAAENTLQGTLALNQGIYDGAIAQNQAEYDASINTNTLNRDNSKDNNKLEYDTAKKQFDIEITDINRDLSYKQDQAKIKNKYLMGSSLWPPQLNNYIPDASAGADLDTYTFNSQLEINNNATALSACNASAQTNASINNQIQAQQQITNIATAGAVAHGITNSISGALPSPTAQNPVLNKTSLVSGFINTGIDAVMLQQTFSVQANASSNEAQIVEQMNTVNANNANLFSSYGAYLSAKESYDQYSLYNTIISRTKDAWETQRFGDATEDSSGGIYTNIKAVKDNIADRTKRELDENAATIQNGKDTNAGDVKDGRDTQALENYDTEISAIKNMVKQAGLMPPKTFGIFSSGDTNISRPMITSFNVITQNDMDISLTGDEMLRYGYFYNRYWELENFQVMNHFTYWKCSDLFIGVSSKVNKIIQSTIKDIFLAGVTVWDSDSNIGLISIYDNWR